MEEQPKYGVVVGVTEQPAPSGVVVGVVMEQPGASEGREGGRGSLEFLGRWNENKKKRAMPIKLKAERNRETMVRVALSRLVDELVQTNASSGILAISNWKEMRGKYEVTVSKTSWSVSGTSYQRHGFVGMESDQSENIRFVDFEGVVDDLGDEDQMAVYRVTLPSGGLDADKWAGRPPPLAPADLFTGPRRDGLLSTEEISGDYCCCCFPFVCQSMTVAPLGPDAIETWSEGCLFFPPWIGPIAEGAVRTRKPGTDAFLNPQNPDPNCNYMTFSADGTASCCYIKRQTSQKRAFKKVETKDLAGTWCGCVCIPVAWPISPIFCTTKRALNENQYAESGCGGTSLTLCLPLIPVSATRTRQYVNGHATNGFADGDGKDIHWHRDPGCAAAWPPIDFFIAKKLC